MVANKYVLLPLLILVFVGTSCIPSATPTFPTAQPEPTVTPIQQQPTSTVFIAIPPISNPLIQSDNESKDEFIVRIASRISKRPFLVTLSEMVSERNLWLGVSPMVNDMVKCWIVEVDSMKQCTTENIRNYTGNPNARKIFFAFVYSDSAKELFILDYYRPTTPYDMSEKDMQDTMDGYRLVIELQDGKWVEKSLIQVY